MAKVEKAYGTSRKPGVSADVDVPIVKSAIRPTVTVAVRVLSPKELKAVEVAAWHEGMTHALTWLGLKQYGEVMGKDNPYGRAG